MKITKRLTNNKNHYSGINSCKYITIHQTGNTSVGANAEAHARFINNGSSETWHYTVDDSKIVQHYNDKVRCWHAGNRQGNYESIGVELCINSDGNYGKTLDLAVKLINHLMSTHNIPISKVVQHNHWSGKPCPKQLRNSYKGISWNAFIGTVKGGRVIKPSKPSKPSNNIDNLVLRTLRGDFGNGVERKRKLGKNYNEVQRIINNGSIKTSKVNINELVRKTLRGDFGNGEERKRKLGKNYDEVQRRINKMY